MLLDQCRPVHGRAPQDGSTSEHVRAPARLYAVGPYTLERASLKERSCKVDLRDGESSEQRIYNVNLNSFHTPHAHRPGTSSMLK
eukprot:scaffold1541_cov418-Prasinococcus_capsulatus_cf.AAC.6